MEKEKPSYLLTPQERKAKIVSFLTRNRGYFSTSAIRSYMGGWEYGLTKRCLEELADAGKIKSIQIGPKNRGWAGRRRPVGRHFTGK